MIHRNNFFLLIGVFSVSGSKRTVQSQVFNRIDICTDIITIDSSAVKVLYGQSFQGGSVSYDQILTIELSWLYREHCPAAYSKLRLQFFLYDPATARYSIQHCKHIRASDLYWAPQPLNCLCYQKFDHIVDVGCTNPVETVALIFVFEGRLATSARLPQGAISLISALSKGKIAFPAVRSFLNSDFMYTEVNRRPPVNEKISDSTIVALRVQRG